MKKITSLLVSCVLCLSLFAGCDSPSLTSENNSAPSENTSGSDGLSSTEQVPKGTKCIETIWFYIGEDEAEGLLNWIGDTCVADLPYSDERTVFNFYKNENRAQIKDTDIQFLFNEDGYLKNMITDSEQIFDDIVYENDYGSFTWSKGENRTVKGTVADGSIKFEITNGDQTATVNMSYDKSFITSVLLDGVSEENAVKITPETDEEGSIIHCDVALPIEGVLTELEVDTEPSNELLIHNWQKMPLAYLVSNLLIGAEADAYADYLGMFCIAVCYTGLQ